MSKPTDHYLIHRMCADVLHKWWAERLSVPDEVKATDAEIAAALAACQGALVDRLTEGER